ncbi:hypothetical protein PDK11_10770 [Bacillus cereus]|nr:hypothetical protein [Bacillus cereus]
MAVFVDVVAFDAKTKRGFPPLRSYFLIELPTTLPDGSSTSLFISPNNSRCLDGMVTSVASSDFDI